MAIDTDDDNKERAVMFDKHERPSRSDDSTDDVNDPSTTEISDSGLHKSSKLRGSSKDVIVGDALATAEATTTATGEEEILQPEVTYGSHSARKEPKKGQKYDKTLTNDGAADIFLLTASQSVDLIKPSE